MTPARDGRAGRVFVGVGARRGAGAEEVVSLITRTLAESGRDPGCDVEVVALATADAKAGEAGLVAAAERLGVPLLTYGAGELAAVPVPRPSAAVLAAVGTPGVAEAAALLAAGPGGVLLVGKRKSARVTCAVAGPGPLSSASSPSPSPSSSSLLDGPG
ncbi:cobalamin biosynthesis protein [Streptomyces syringium]|uniref:cobalamin biosynthesis protein n=1 Tax=Streptomyces syringium TaxID=76729 RepID=UPI0036E86DEA